eukprot:CAMPEP_0170522274 /NCGR_PEP_ID=MMETSP0209-20121228/7722_1 /TAXON_ID=665100 ORGANISM="Litonotus pictus, Strain P1" /NCGR_SAMPLE_ID=MMETSP0209 /ASSEMBLY_ACC=CAM_ASM_000301 /LENGTH=352 /DNA_ID=CAMNT_0010809705 /DNA_START=1126 /DNA_END=2181 /DNA_ORIENTATION=-
MKNQKILMKTLPQGFQIIPNGFFKAHEEEEWLQAVLGRLEVEKEITSCINKHTDELETKRLLSEVIEEKGMEKLEFLEEDVNKSNELDTNKQTHDSSALEESLHNKDDESLSIPHYYADVKSDTHGVCLDEILRKPSNKQKLELFGKYFPVFPQLTSKCFNVKLNSSNCKKKSSKHPCVKTFWDEHCKLNQFIPLTSEIERSLQKKQRQESQEQVFLLDPTIVYSDSMDENYYLKLNIDGNISQYDLSTKENTRSLLSKYLLGDIDSDHIDWVLSKLSNSFIEMKHPGVDTSVIFINSFQTDIKYDYKGNPKDLTDNDITVEEEIDIDTWAKYGGGDTTVPAASTMIPFMKW